MMRILALLPLIALAPATPATTGADGASLPQAGAGQAKAPDCKKCKSTGRLPCPEHPRAECELEDAVLFCSVVADCAVCGGTAWIPCEACKNEAARAALDKKKDLVQKRKLALKGIDDRMGRPLRKAESDHFVLIWEMDKLKVEKKVLGPHELLHLYIQRHENVYADFVARLEVGPKEFSEKPWIFVWYLFEDHQSGGMKFCEGSASGGIKLLGVRPRYSICGNKRHFQDDEELHRNLVHSTAHLLLSNQTPAGWIGNIKGGWADEGLAHWFEDRYWGICDTYCYQEANTNVDFKGGKFRLATRKLVADGEAPGVAEVFQQNIDTLTLPMHAVSFSYVDYLLSKDGKKFSELVKKLKLKIPTRDALQQTFGMSPIEFETQWKAWVLETYPTR